LFPRLCNSFLGSFPQLVLSWTVNGGLILISEFERTWESAVGYFKALSEYWVQSRNLSE
jgi:hypothetical protein